MTKVNTVLWMTVISLLLGSCMFVETREMDSEINQDDVVRSEQQIYATSITEASNESGQIEWYVDGPKDRNNEDRIKTITISAVGDLMVHRSQLVKADVGEGFDFSPSFDIIQPYIESADFAVANLETTLAGYMGQRRINTDMFYEGYSGYPCFNTPDVLASNIKNAGFDLVSTANNHSLDSKEEGVIRTLDILDDTGLLHTGSYRTEDQAAEPAIVEVEGIRFAVHSFTYGLNGFVLDEDRDYMINHLDMYNSERIDAMMDAVKASEDHVDFVIVMLHFGNEYVTEPDNYYQRPIVDGLFAAGADIIFGGHPHVVQPIEVRDVQRTPGKVEKGVVIYSLGNFLSSQRSAHNNGNPTDIGMIFEVSIKQVDDLEPQINELSFITTFTHWSQNAIQILPTKNVPEDIHLSHYDLAQINRANTEITALLTSYLDVPIEQEKARIRVKLLQ